ncbi:hypothetical protein [Hansschlegelia zhihuaiae]|uniref:Uncharacterized protein n=1 Tax=Hansschlegelia zhihuaiae TaxID=405005 RepID=A0A4Q0MHC6_9HYPH|nr:hypothetical protein [Hansschlegelia zhihuaiae]RXF72898.1 hypothetical protein EK403_12135 [Hansschlegelia zhihuaiae]
MGLVLAFDSAPRPPSRQSARRRDTAGSADILLFTGVRYERHGVQQAPQAERPTHSSGHVTPVQ